MAVPGQEPFSGIQGAQVICQCFYLLTNLKILLNSLCNIEVFNFLKRLHFDDIADD